MRLATKTPVILPRFFADIPNIDIENDDADILLYLLVFVLKLLPTFSQSWQTSPRLIIDRNQNKFLLWHSVYFLSQVILAAITLQAYFTLPYVKHALVLLIYLLFDEVKIEPGTELFFQKATLQVSSPLQHFTVEFGMESKWFYCAKSTRNICGIH